MMPDLKLLSESETLHYAKHLNLEEIGLKGQTRLKQSKVLIIGAGGLGNPVSLYLAAAGVGTLGIVEFDCVDQTNLHRQVIYGVSDLGQSKLQRTLSHLKNLNPFIHLHGYEEKLSPQNAIQIISKYDLVIDCTDNFPTRYLINDACVITQKPFISASILKFEGQLAAFNHHNSPCYRCVYPEAPAPHQSPSCSEAGVLGVLPGVLGTLQANEALKIILDLNTSSTHSFYHFDALTLDLTRFEISKDPNCASCSENKTITALAETHDSCQDGFVSVVSVQELKLRLKAKENLLLLDVRDKNEREESQISPSSWIPLSELDLHYKTLDKSMPLITYCKLGERSKKAALLLTQKGFYVQSLQGGIEAWNKINS